MRPRLKYGLAGLALVLSCLFGAPAAFANNYTGDCATYPGAFDGNGDVDITEPGSCSIGSIAATGHIHITASGSVTAGNLTTTYGEITVTNSSGAVSTGDISPGWYATIIADGALTTGTILAPGGEVNLTSYNGAVTPQDITGFYHVVITAKNDIHLGGALESLFNEVHLTSTDGDVITSDPIKAYYSNQIEATNGKVTINEMKSTFYDVKVKAGDEITTDKLTGGTYGNLVVTTTSGDITTKELATGYSIKVKADDGAIDLDTVTSNTGDLNGNILIVGSQNIKTKNIVATGTSSYGGVEIRANTSGGSTEFIVGGTGNTNGVNGTIDTTNTTGGGTTADFIHGGVLITNGTTSAGGIRLTNMNDLKVNASGSRSGIIILDAKDGNITLPGGGALQSDGTGSNGAGAITLNGKEIHFGNDTTVSASQSSTATGTAHYVQVAAETLTFGGTSTGLVLKADGDGDGIYTKGAVQVLPQGSLTINSNYADSDDSYQYLYWYTLANPTNAALNITGGSSSPLKISANGSVTAVDIRGNGTTFTGGDVTIEAKGKVGHTINILDSGSADNKGLTFGVLGNVVVDASGDNGAGSGASGGDIQISSDIITLNGASHTFKAAGPASGDGDGGAVYFAAAQYTSLIGTSKVTINADAAPSGNGNGVTGDPAVYGRKAVQFYPGSINVDYGNAAGQYLISAKGGSSGGNGGTVLLSSSFGALKAVGAGADAAIDVSAQAGDSNGGEIYFYNYVGFANGAEAKANGTGTGNGGKFTSYYYDPANPLGVKTFIKVEGASTQLATAENDFGRVTINGVICQQRTTGQAAWPSTYWNCAHPDASNVKESSLKDALIALPATFQGLLSDVDVYVMANSAAYNSYFNSTLSVEAQGVSTSGQKRAAVFEAKGTGPIDISGFLKGALMHEMGHLVNAYDGNPQGGAGFIAAYTADKTNMIGNYPTAPQAPTCMQVFNNNGFCTAHSADANPWITFKTAFIGTQPEDSEMFAFAFQTCSSYSIFDDPLDYAEFTNQYNMVAPNLGYMSNINNWMNTYWPGGCH